MTGKNKVSFRNSGKKMSLFLGLSGGVAVLIAENQLNLGHVSHY